MTDWYDNVTAPTDANGEMVPLDTRELLFDGKRSRVMCYLYGPTTRIWYVEFAGVGERPHLSDCTLPDSWERLEKDAAKDPCVYFGYGAKGLCGYFGMDDAHDCKGCPAYEDSLYCDCNIKMTRDIIRRAKALAGVTDGE